MYQEFKNNRNILECKSIPVKLYPNSARGIIETYWNVNIDAVISLICTKFE